MGYRPQRKVYVLDFGANYGGLEVKVRSGTLGQLLELQRLGAVADEGADKADALLAHFATLLKEWNVEDDDGGPVPATLDGLKSLPPDLAMEIVQAGAKAIGGVPDPLAGPSPAGEPSAVASLPTVPLSANPPSS